MIKSKIQYYLRNWIIKLQKAWYYRPQTKFQKDLSFSDMANQNPVRNAMYGYAVHYYAHKLPFPLKEHREYFKQCQRGFGEDSFHAMWWLLMREFKPKLCLEIGIYRGQVISLWALIAQILEFSCEIHGISPFTPIGDTLSTYREDVDYLTDTLNSFTLFNLPTPTLVKALSTEPEALNHIANHKWDLIYIDGSHDYDVALADYRICHANLSLGGLLVMDDASLYSDFRAPHFSFAGHPGPSRVVKENVMREMNFLGAIGHNNVFQKQ